MFGAWYDLQNVDRLGEFKSWLSENIFTSKRGGNLGGYMSNLKLYIEDDKLNEVIKPIEKINKLFAIMIPVVLVVIAFISFGLSYYITNNNLSNIALLRVLGVGRVSITLQIILENVLVCIIGIGLGIALSIGISNSINLNFMEVIGLIMRDLAIYFISYTVEGIVSSVIVTSTSTIEILTKN